MKPAAIRLILFTILTSVLPAVFLPLNLAASEKIIEKTDLYMGTIVQIKAPLVSGEDERLVNRVIEKAFNEIGRVERLFSAFKQDSEVSKINSLHAGEVLKISAEVFDLIEKTIEYNKKTDGAFDITVKPLVDLWAGARAGQVMPSEGEIKEALAKVGSQFIALDGAKRTISFRKNGMAIDLAGVAKGYATDRAMQVLKENGVKNAIVNAGGDMHCLGSKSGTEPWIIGIQHPRDKAKVLTELKLRDKAVDTSGDYEKYFVLDGKRYSHIIDPRSGFPVGDDVVSATAIAGDSTKADIFATALCVLGRKGIGVAEVSGVDALIVFKKGDGLETVKTKGFAELYEIGR